ncbi:cobalamin biosynthesis protein CobW [Cellulomonas hominis]|uniref:Cobalamin biosynthesis protein CobW n=1 Tax=Cellulomonas hominis TaxID=156981 RepID=A0A511FCC6_9CELL|nr:GTP-binding protein [Cellulomonas hominis]MBB5471815.1 G3E family GTPase [Cellulomonas hominis]GEL46901.1 cobalamin biosynthesis protein CobW [Cellulomonas hominis]
MTQPKPLVVLATVGPLLRDAVALGVVVDHPRTVVLRHDIVDGPDGGGIRRVVADAGGVLEDVLVPLAHACLSCSVREDAVPTLERLARDPRWDQVLLALPVSAESLPVTRALGAAAGRAGRLRGLRLASVVAALDLAAFEDDLLGDDLLDERGVALTADDERAVGEALAAQVAHADVVLVAGEPAEHPVASDLLDHVRAADGLRVDGVLAADAAALFAGAHDLRAGDRRLDPRRAAPVPDAPTRHGVWTLDLRADRALHPERLVADVARLGQGRHRSRGRFWVPSRPDSVCAWDGAGGQLSVGEVGTWGRRAPGTRLVFTGVQDVRADLLAAFEDVLLTADEHARGLHPWLGREDVLAPWLGDRAA